MSGRSAASSRVAVIGGGQNGEHDVSLASAASVASALASVGYDVVRLTIGRDGSWRRDGEGIGFDVAVRTLRTCVVAVPMLHGPRGEDGTAAALCELAGVRYVGSGVRAGAIAMDKWTTKLVAEAVGVPTVPGRLLRRSDLVAGLAGVPWQGPVVVKPVCAGSSVGVTLVEDAATLSAAIEAALAHDDRVLVEDRFEGREIDVAVLRTGSGEVRVGPALEIVGGGVFDYETKYGGGADFRLPVELDDARRKELEAHAVAVFEALGCRGVARVDFFLGPDGFVLNEVNTTPGMTEQSQVPRMFAAAGLPYPALLDLLVRDVVAAPSG